VRSFEPEEDTMISIAVAQITVPGSNPAHANSRLPRG
jgi:hypothetical protein